MGIIDSFTPPESTNTVKMLAGISGPGAQPLNNMPTIWFELVKRLQKGDVMICGGDFIQACAGCCLPLESNDGSMTCAEAGKLVGFPCCEGKTCDMNCICPCSDNNLKFPPAANDLDLIKETIAAMKRGAYIVFVDDFMFIDIVYKSNKPNHEYVFLTLLKASNELLSGNNNIPLFYWYVMPTEGPLHIHSKIFTFYFIGEKNKDKPYVVSHIGSFNPSFPISLTLEISTVCNGLTTNFLMRGLGTYVYDLVMAVIKNYNTINKINIQEPLPLIAIREALGINDTLLFKDPIYSDVEFCGKTFCSSKIDNSKYHEDEQRITFKSSNVEFKIGGEPKRIFWRFNYGLDLVNNLINDSKKYLKIGIMANIIEKSPYPDSTWMVEDSITKQIDNKLPIYIMQKPNPILAKDEKIACENIYKIPAPSLWKETEQKGYNSMSVRWYKSGFHWKFYMNENAVLLSTQHPTNLFYSENGSMGYEVSIKHPDIVSYFDNIYNFYWKYVACKAGFDPDSPDDLPCSSSQKGKCCIIPNASNTSTCFPGGKGVKYSCKDNSCVEDPNGEYISSNCEGKCSKSKSSSKLVISLAILGIFLLLLLLLLVIKK